MKILNGASTHSTLIICIKFSRIVESMIVSSCKKRNIVDCSRILIKLETCGGEFSRFV